MAKAKNKKESPSTNQPEVKVAQEEATTVTMPVVEPTPEPEQDKEEPATNEVIPVMEAKIMGPEIVKQPEPIHPSVRPELDKSLPFEDRILAFIESRGGGMVKLNDFLKSLYPIPRLNEPPIYSQQHEGKKLRVLLGTMQATGKIELANNNYLNLGKVCQSEPKEGNAQPTFTHNLNTVIIEARKK